MEKIADEIHSDYSLSSADPDTEKKPKKKSPEKKSPVSSLSSQSALSTKSKIYRLSKSHNSNPTNFFEHTNSLFSYPTPLNCTKATRLCTSFLAFKPNLTQTLAVIQNMFDVFLEDVYSEGNDQDYVFIKKNCPCASNIKKYFTNTTFTVRENGGSVYNLVIEAYGGLAFLSNNTRAARMGAVVSL